MGENSGRDCHIKKPVASFNSLAKVVLRWLKSLIGFLGLQWWCYRGKLNSLLAINDVSCTFSGITFCKAMQLNMSIYMAGTIIWSCLTALTRVLYIKVTSWVRFRKRENFTKPVTLRISEKKLRNLKKQLSYRFGSRKRDEVQ